MFEYMGDRLTNAIRNIKGMGRITEENINDAVREIRMALLEADVNYTVVKEFINNVKEKALGQEVDKSLKPDELFILVLVINIHNQMSPSPFIFNTMIDCIFYKWLKCKFNHFEISQLIVHIDFII